MPSSLTPTPTSPVGPDTTVTPGILYYYKVNGDNASGYGGYSNTASATAGSAIPAAPSGLTATPISNAINLAWTDNSSNEDGFRVWRSTAPTSGFVIIKNTVAGVTSYSDTSATPGTLFYYRITAYNNNGDSAPSNTANTSIPAAPSMPVALKALWRFDETTGTVVSDTDTDGVSDTGTITGAATRTAGKVGNALTLSGSTQYVQVANSTDVNISGTGFTIALFAKSGAANWNSTNTFASKGNGYRFGGVSGTKNIQFGLYIGNAWRTLTYTNPGDISANYHHYAGTYDGVTMRIWVDGVNVASMARTGSIAANTSVLYLGRISNTYLNGSIDEVRLYNTALDATAIGNLNSQGALSVTGLSANSGNAASYSVQNYALATGISQYGDITRNFTTVPSKYLGQTFIRTAQADVTSTASNLLSFTVNQPVIVSIIFDDAIAVKPTWLTSQFTDSGDNIVTAQGTFSVYNAVMGPGTIVLGGAGGLAGQGMYSVLLTNVL